jgi:hypothetical protein
MRNRAVLMLLCVAALPLLAGCPSTLSPSPLSPCGGNKPLFPGSRYYEPASEWERREFERADRYVYPDDVRQDPEQYPSATVAWPGVIVDSTFHEEEEGMEAVLLLEHHYFDWIEDFGAQPERFFLSPRGEGAFKASWSLEQGAAARQLRDAARPGNLAIVYGVPNGIEGDAVNLKSVYVRIIDQACYTTEILDYGRLDETGEEEAQ